MKTALLAILFLAVPALAEEKKPAPPPSISGVLDKQLTNIETSFVPLVEAMPADKFDFAPAGDGFKDVRTFKQQIGHVGVALEKFACAILGEKFPYAAEDAKGGPAKLKTKDDYVAFIKAAFAHAHKAVQTVNEKNELELVGDGNKNTRLGYANIMTWHSFDHYGQLVVYARLNGIVPPASRNN
jgi:DinB superfamily